jgi:hypothetical protein
MQSFTVSKRTGTHADVLAAVGAADLLAEFEPALTNRSDRFEIHLKRAPTPQALALSDPGFRYLLRLSKKPPKLPASQVYELAKPAGAPLDADQRMYSIMARLGADGGPNKLMMKFGQLSAHEWSGMVWDGLHGREEFVTRPSLVQLFNPQAARGYSLLKPAGTDRADKSKDAWSEPFLEWLRYRGYFHACSGWFLEKDIRLFTAVPGEISYRLYRSVMQAFRELRLAGSAAKVDSRAVLGLTRILIDQMETYRRPASLIDHVSIAHYRNMGQANTLMAIQQLAIPDWFALENGADASLWRKILDEHDKAIRRLNDASSDHLAVIHQYRRCLQARNDVAIEEFVLFLQDFGLLLFKSRAENERWLLPQFTMDTISPILNRHAICRSILQNPGFQRVAQALRSSTVNAQTAKHNAARGHRELRYGVLSAMKRSAAVGKRALIQTVEAFVTEHNAETARRYEFLWKDGRVREKQFAGFIQAVEAAPAATLAGSLFCAVATCRRHEEAAESMVADLEQAAAV